MPTSSFIRLWFPDILGNLKGFAINAADLRDAIEEGVGFDGSAIESYARSDESDMRAFPDPNTFHPAPLAPPAERRGPDVLRHPASRRRQLRPAIPGLC